MKTKELIVSPIYNAKGNIVGQEYHGELIRCKDCRFRDQFGFCRRWLWQKAPKMEDEEYCSCAVRREE